jgi:DNA-binding transcriptional regulator YiaG
MAKILPFFANKNWSTPGAVRSMQEYLGFSNKEFAKFCGISMATLERLVYQPSQHTCRLLDLAADRALRKEFKNETEI